MNLNVNDIVVVLSSTDRDQVGTVKIITSVDDLAGKVFASGNNRAYGNWYYPNDLRKVDSNGSFYITIDEFNHYLDREYSNVIKEMQGYLNTKADSGRPGVWSRKEFGDFNYSPPFNFSA